ncbi:MAG: type III-B CRISPR module RAMP protein Cmr1 [Paenibacillus sp.]|nr:type III-B CRISPR module RAMP protein Cmr1 [Paenibacillus sp.]
MNQAQEQWINSRESYLISVVTPVFGGGVKAGELKCQPTIRNSSVRGHLRFWWRATRGAVYKDVSELRKREAQIFGDTKESSRVKIWVSPSSPKQSSDQIELKNVNLPSYVIFPYREFYKKNPSFSFDLPYTFELNIQLQDDDLKKELDPALWAWINFGGIGSRTRRGCGSLYCDTFSPEKTDTVDLKAWYRKNLVDYELKLEPNPEREWPTLSNEIQIQRPNDQGIISAWGKVINVYKKFRGTPGFKKRSLWPEADSLRNITDMAVERHKQVHPKGKSRDELFAFPRAQLGLPIIFRFKQDPKHWLKLPQEWEPYDTTLKPKGKNRLASSLITKVIALNEKKGVGAFIKLNQPQIKELELSITVDDKESDHKKQTADQIKNKPISERDIYKKLHYWKNPMGSTDDVIEAFFKSDEVKEWKKGR